MGEDKILRAPDPALLPELLPEELCRTILESGICFVVDIDGTIVDSNPMYLRWLSHKLKRRIRVEDYRRYNFRDIDSQALGMLQAVVFGSPRMHRSLPLVRGAKSALRQIAKICLNGKRKIKIGRIPIVILTARPTSKGMVKMTYDHLRRRGIPFDVLIFSRRKKEVIKSLKKLGHVVVLDDDPNVIRAVAPLKEVTAIVFNAFYNETLKVKGVLRVKEWSKVLRIVKQVWRLHRQGKL